MKPERKRESFKQTVKWDDLSSMAVEYVFSHHCPPKKKKSPSSFPPSPFLRFQHSLNPYIHTPPCTESSIPRNKSPKKATKEEAWREFLDI